MPERQDGAGGTRADIGQEVTLPAPPPERVVRGAAAPARPVPPPLPDRTPASAGAGPPVRPAVPGPVPGGDEVAADDENIVGKCLGAYQVGQLMGAGGIGRVYYAQHIELGTRVAIKVLHPQYSRRPDLIERLRREARAMAALDHPRIVRVLHSGTTPGGRWYIVMEYLEGRDLGSELKSGRPLGIERAVGIMLQVCDAMQAAHGQGIVHRDLKPDNVFLVSNGGGDCVKVVDFGIARSLDESGVTSRPVGGAGAGVGRLTVAGSITGTPFYMAPEQALGQTDIDARADVFALGVMLYQLLTGQLPHQGTTIPAIVEAKLRQTPKSVRELRPEVSEALAALVHRALVVDREQRVQTVSELKDGLEAAMRPAPAQVHAPLSAPREAEGPRWGVLALLLVILAAAVYGYRTWSKDQDNGQPPPMQVFTGDPSSLNAEEASSGKANKLVEKKTKARPKRKAKAKVGKAPAPAGAPDAAPPKAPAPELAPESPPESAPPPAVVEPPQSPDPPDPVIRAIDGLLDEAESEPIPGSDNP